MKSQHKGDGHNKQVVNIKGVRFVYTSSALLFFSASHQNMILMMIGKKGRNYHIVAAPFERLFRSVPYFGSCEIG